MCFRPAETAVPKTCINCGKLIMARPNEAAPEECPFCGGKLIEKNIGPKSVNSLNTPKPSAPPVVPHAPDISK